MFRKLMVAFGAVVICAAVVLAQEGIKTKLQPAAPPAATRPATKSAPPAATKPAAPPATTKAVEPPAATRPAAPPPATRAAEPPATTKAKAPAAEAPAAAPAAASPLVLAVKSYEEAFNKNDAAALAAHWAEEGVYVDRETGQRTQGREAIQADFQKLFQEKRGARLSLEMTSSRMVKPDVASLEGSAVAVLPGEEPSQTSFTAILVKQGDQWLIDSVQETPQATPTAHDALAELEWLVGHWVDESETTRVDTAVRWSPGNSFLVRSFVIQTAEEEEEQQGTQVIGWDPQLKQIRSWSFFSDGSFGEGLWSKSGNEWLVKGTHTLNDGRQALGTQVVEREGDDTLLVRIIGREIDGEPLPNSELVKVVRVAEAEASEVGAAETAAPPASEAKDVEGTKEVAETKEVDK